MKITIDNMMKTFITPQSMIKLVSSILLYIFKSLRVEVAINSMAVVATTILTIE